MKNKILILLLCCFGFLTSCSEWLEVESKKEISAELLFEEGVGFRNALNGIFQDCGKSGLYGKSLSWGALSAIAQTYDLVETKDEIYYFKDFKYNNDANMISIYSNWWNSMYNIIANINTLLAHIEDADPSIFAEGEKEKNLIKGEALAMRAFLHFDIVRLFAPAPSQNKDFKMIPYQNVFPLKITMPQSTNDLLDCVAADLLEAKELVVQWDTIDGINNMRADAGRRFDDTRNVPAAGKFFHSRIMRMNYCAIIGMLVRTYLYKGDYTEALTWARYFYNSFMTGGEALVEGYEFFPYLAASEYSKATSTRPKKLLEEVIFGLYNANLLVEVENYYQSAKEAELKGLSLARFDKLFENDGDDYRKLYLFEDYGNEDVGELYKSFKFREIAGSSMTAIEGPVIPNMRLPEMAYALIECEYRVGDKEKALTVLNQLRRAKGPKRVLAMEDISNLDKLLDILVNDMERETIGEGQVFFMYKRLNRDFVSPKNETIAISDEKVVFEIPDSQFTN